jgi:hypothetical protein
MSFTTNASEAMRIDSSGNAHIGGTTSITTAVTGDNVAPKLIVEGTTATSIAVLRQDTSIVSGNSLGSLGFYGTDTTSNTPTPLAAVQALASGTHAAGDNPTDLRFLTTPDNSATMAEAMRIDAAGNVLVGKSASSFTTAGVELAQGGTAGKVQIMRASGGLTVVNTTNDGAAISIYKGTTVVGSIGNRFNALYIHSPHGTNGAGLRFFDGVIQPCESNGNNSDGDTDLGQTNSRFKDLYLSGNVTHGVTPSSSAAGVFTEAVGRTTYSRGSATGGFAHLTFINGNGSVGSVVTSGTATAYNTSSDYRLKENVVSLTSATARLNQLAPKRFNFIADANVTVDGFLAHEVADVVPEAITGAKDAMRDEEYEVTPAVLGDDGNVVTEAVMGTRSVPDYQGIDQSKLVPLLVATIQELEARITQLENN